MKKHAPLLILSFGLSLTLGACLQPHAGGTPAPKQPTAVENPNAKPTATGAPVGRLTRAKDISRYLKVHQGRFLACFEAAKKENPALAGNVKLEGMLYPDGSIKAVMINEGSLRDPKARTCMIGELTGLKVPEAKVDLPTRVVFPLQFGM